MNIGSRSIKRLLTGVLSVGNGTRISYPALLEASGIPDPNTLAKAVREAKEQGLIVVESGHGRVANRYEVPRSIAALMM